MRRSIVGAALILPLFLTQDPTSRSSGPRIPAVGESAPRFRLNDHEGRGVSVGGKHPLWTVVAFYPKASTPG